MEQKFIEPEQPHDNDLPEEDKVEVAPPIPDHDNTITFKRTHLYSVLLPLTFVIGLSVGYLLWGRTPAPSTAAVVSTPQSVAQSPAQQTTPSYQRYDIALDDDPIYGPEDAEITIVEFSDYECPYCQKWHTQVLPQLLTQYEGQIRLVFRDFPLNSIHPNALGAAEAANCAREQNMYWEFNDSLFNASQSLSQALFQQIAGELGLDMDSFNACLESDVHLDEVQADLDYAVNLGVRSTPTFFINGIPVVGAQPFEVFAQLIDKELAGELP